MYPKRWARNCTSLCGVRTCVDEDVAAAIGGTGWDTTIKPYQRSSSPVQRFEPLVTRRSLNAVRVATVQHPVAPSWSRRDSNNGERKKEAGKGEKRSLTLGSNFAETVAHHELRVPCGQRTPKPTRRLAGNSLGIALASMLEEFLYKGTMGCERYILAARVEEFSFLKWRQEINWTKDLEELLHTNESFVKRIIIIWEERVKVFKIYKF